MGAERDNVPPIMGINTRNVVVSVFVLGSVLGATGVGCKSGDGGGADYARKQAAEADKIKYANAPKAVKVETPVQGGTTIPCDRLLVAEEFGGAIGEEQPVEIRDVTSTDKDATAVCSIVRGGEKLDIKAQEKIVAKQGRLGVIAGDEICNIGLYCWYAADEAALKERCASMGDSDNNALGVYACVRTVQQGADDVYSYKFMDADTKCTLQVRGGASLVDDMKVQACARTAMQQIGPAQIAAQ